tara:strand:+ start:5630 stop:7066 length:1437 start_codon:yes stop_codon:yes gene_type:complete
MSQISYKSLTQDDIDISRTILHESVPITGTLLSGTYATSSTSGRELNIKTYTHGMFQSIYDYPHLSSSSNHLLDVTVGLSTTPTASLSASNVNQVSKKVNIYNQMAQVLAGYTTASTIRRFDNDGNLTDGVGKIDNAIFLNFSRLLTKDEIKKGSFSMVIGAGSAYASPYGSTITVSDSTATTNFRTNSPAGEYGFLKNTAAAASVNIVFTGAPSTGNAITIRAIKEDATFASASFSAHGSNNTGLNFDKSGTTAATVANLKAAIERNTDIKDLVTVSAVQSGTTITVTQVNKGAGGNTTVTSNLANVSVGGATAGQSGVFIGGVSNITTGLIYYQAGIAVLTSSVFGDSTQIMNNASSSHDDVLTNATIDDFADGLRRRVQNVTFNNTTELNSSIYFCRLKANEFNYSSNPTYLSESKIVVKTNPGVVNEYLTPPISYVTTVGLYSANNELLAVSKLSEPLKKTPTNELTLRVRLDY